MAADSLMPIIWILLGFMKPFGVLESSVPPGPVDPPANIDCMEARLEFNDRPNRHFSQIKRCTYLLAVRSELVDLGSQYVKS
ncbi:hypothetical protein K450DRAFT_226462 [Umbelopsis ramanniana AG]|uniref:Secreted protein n=1 Tax=Umbelopsis ramanniana AG TaxID=1314678 RepID=A0AAD5EFZ0_UMBRA|nr:uncharacterized protein K450DRAFT_226462 [Umbelopsis ramanniana AG]KAI8582697.1 hypothetical protein K450DRAFT_226462 [Umbelopsis ramanniana AG]